VATCTLEQLTGGVRPLDTQQRLRLGDDLFCAGDAALLHGPAIAVVGSREASNEGLRRAHQLARELVGARVVVVSGLARGIDTEALRTAIELGGRVAAVIGTPLDRCTPVSNARLQEAIYTDHLLVSPFALGSKVHRGNFPERNKAMAALTDATVIVEASESSGTLHQAAECARLGRKLFFPQSLLTERGVAWPRRFIDSGSGAVFSKAEEVLACILRA
jgi:DNA processing protein